VGTLATVIEPGASELFEWAKNLNVPIVFDPNIRPSVLADQSLYREKVERWVKISKVIKLSQEDLELLGYLEIQAFFDLGAKLVVLTKGANGITGFTKSGSISVPGFTVDVVDTVGAGDTVGAVIVEGLVKYGFDALVGEKLFEVLTRAARAASITCSRAGANPPTDEELGA
jgi:fructokinase